MGLEKNKKNINTKCQKIYRTDQEHLSKIESELTWDFEYTVLCPRCTGRAFDFVGLPRELLLVRLKGPHCRKIVEAPIISEETSL
jgi:hypothetical protein